MLVVVSGAIAAALAGCGKGEQPASAPAGRPAFSPYVDVTLSPPLDLASLGDRAGARSLTLAFVTRGGDPCAPAWGGQLPVGSDPVAAAADRLRAKGISVRVSFGGRSGTDLARSCTSAARLAAAYQTIVDRYHAAGVDFDVEGPAVADLAAASRRGEAIRRLQAAARTRGGPLHVSLTLPVVPRGLPPEALALVRATLARGARIDAVNVLAMDYGEGELPDPRGRMGSAAIRAVSATRQQLAEIDRSLGRWERLGVTPMIGVNDVAGEVLTLAEARTLAAFARNRRLPLVSMWSLARDRPCPPGTPAMAVPTCSGVGSPALAFARVFEAPGARG